MTGGFAHRFQQDVGADLAAELPGEFRFSRSLLELRRPAHRGADVIRLAGSAKWSPLISVNFYFGRSFDEAERVEKALGEPVRGCHIDQYSLNLGLMAGVEYAGPSSWDVDLRSPSRGLVRELKAAIEGMAFPFFERFRDPRAARDAIASNDSWCFGGPLSWRSLFFLDAALDDLGHFKSWSARLQPFDAAQAAEIVAKFERVVLRRSTPA